MNDTVYIICILAAQILLIFCGAFFAATETAFTSISKISARQMLKANEKNVRHPADARRKPSEHGSRD